MKHGREFITDNDGFIDFTKILSHNAIFNFVESVRNTGKTTLAKAWAFLRYKKRGKKVLWIRTFEDEAKQIRGGNDFFNNRVLKIIENHGHKVTKDDFRIEGEYVYYLKKKGKKVARDWFIHIISLSEALAIKGNEIKDIDIIIYDEYRAEQKVLNRYSGFQPKDFVNIVVSICRDHFVRAFLLGNKEQFSNPFFDFLKIPYLKTDFEGIATFNENSISVTQLNTVPAAIAQNSMQQKLRKALKNTVLVGYLYEGKTAGVDYTAIEPLPRLSKYLFGFDFNGAIFSMYESGDFLYFKKGLDKARTVLVNYNTHAYPSAFRFSSKDKKYFQNVERAIKFNRVKFCDEYAAEKAEIFLKNFY